MKLYGSETSPYVRKARILLKEKGLSCEFMAADVSAPGSPVASMNPLGKVPVLDRGNGAVLYDSPVIVEYLDSLKSPALLAASGEARWTMLRWQALADGVLDATVARMMETRRPPEQQSARDIARQEEKVARSLDWIETQVGPGKYLMGSDFSLADLVVGVALDYVDFRYPHDWATRLPKLSRWHQAIRQRPSFVETAPATSLSRGPRLDPIGETRAPGMK